MARRKKTYEALAAESLGDWLRKLREEKGVPLRAVAAAADMDQAHLSKVELGRRVLTEKQAASLARYFRVDSQHMEARRIAEKIRQDFAGNPAAGKAVQMLHEGPLHADQAFALADDLTDVTNGGKTNGGRNGGRTTDLPPKNDHVKRAADARNTLNDLNSSEWLPETVSVWTQRGLGANHPDAQIERQHPAPFSFTDVSRLIRFFTKRGAVVLDPFVGVGSTLKACALEGRAGIGFELNAKYARLAKQRLRAEVRDLLAATDSQEVRIGDARTLARDLTENAVDFVVTSPPYWNILHKVDHKANQERKSLDLDTRYSDDKNDLGNIPRYETFLAELASILGSCGRALKPKKYMAVIVSDFRDKSSFVLFHADLAHALRPYGFEMRGLSILYQRHKRVFPYGYPYAYVPNIHHQFILILQNVK